MMITVWNRPWPRASLLCLGAVLLWGCGQTQMVNATAQMRQQMIEGNHGGALATLRQSKNQGFKEQDRVVYWMNEGMLLFLTGQYKASADVLEQAERRARELFTVSISKNVKAAFTSEAATDYAGEDYENVLVNVLKALDYLALGQVSEALVEARKINERLTYYNTKYTQRNVYNQDAFAHWLMGLLFEMERSYDDARIAYVKALEVYQTDFAAHYGLKPPSYLAEDATRAALLSGAAEIAQDLRSRYGANVGQTAETMKSQGEVVLVHMNGEGPTKSDYVVTCWFLSPTEWACDGEPGGEFIKRTTITIPAQGTVVKVAFPELHVHEPTSPFVVLRGPGGASQSEVALPVSRIAVKTMADKMQRVFRDAIIRVITKTASAKAAGAGTEQAAGGGKTGKLLGWAAEQGASATMQAFEEADKRAWTTLPSRIEVARLWLPPGTHTLAFELPGRRTAPLPGIKVEAGKRVVVTTYTLP